MAKIKSRDLQTKEIQETLYIKDCCYQFIQSRRTMNLTSKTVDFYENSIIKIQEYFAANNVCLISEITPVVIRDYIDCLRNKGHNIGGTHLYYRVLKAFLKWVWYEYDLEIRNPIDKVKCQNRPPTPIQGITMDEVQACLDVCSQTKFPERARAMITMLIDTGIRRSELIGLKMKDVRISDGQIIIRHGKGDKFRIVYCGKTCRKYLRRYINCIEEIRDEDPFWLSLNGEPLAVDGAREIIRRVQRFAGIEKVHDFHDFRRCFAIERKRNGDDDITISRALGHSSLEVTKRYLAFTQDDDRAFAMRASQWTTESAIIQCRASTRVWCFANRNKIK